MQKGPVIMLQESVGKKRNPFFSEFPRPADEWMLPAPCGWNGYPSKRTEKKRKGNKDTRIEGKISCVDVGGLSWLMFVHHGRFVDVFVGFSKPKKFVV